MNNKSRTSLGERRELPMLWVVVARASVVVILLLAWQYLPTQLWLRRAIPAFDPFFVSSPTRVSDTIRQLITGSSTLPSIWPYMAFSLRGTFMGGFIGIVLGMALGAVLSNNIRARQVLGPFVTALNATPRVALIPIFVVLFGLSLKTSVVTAVVVVFFSVFYNAYNGGISVPLEMMQSARMLGATGFDITMRIRFKYVLVWTFAALPNAISISLISVVTAEILSGAGGMGTLIVQALSTQNSSLTFAIVVILSLLGVLLVTVADVVQRRVLHWWPGSRRT